MGKKGEVNRNEVFYECREKLELAFRKEELREFKRSNKRQEQSMKQNTRDSSRKHWIKTISAVFFFSSIVLKYTSFTSIPIEVIYSIPAPAILSFDYKSIFAFFKKPPP
ncbi:MAG: hypothetical protein K0S53_77 [Bacteroidetes bacterium]|jgi:hypothetical protein|nr:hypothetical protein [Bacteroidota bacterium]MDF2451716.1 hypothetical protein [Bacteroidota bacterium]